MRIIVWGINYAPELTGIGPFNTGLCEYLVEHGHQVEIATTFPYYPFWQKIPGDRGRLYRTDQIDAVQVHRCWHYVPGKATTLRRIWHELSFALTSFVRVLFLARPDVYLVVSPPLALGPLASIMAWLKRRPYFFHVQDLQPDAAVGLGMVQAGQFTRLLYRLESWAYRDAAVVSGISEGMRRAFLSKGVPESKCVLFPNWLRTVASNVDYRLPEQERGAGSRAFRGKFGIPPAAFVASYSGNLGRKQGLESLVEAAAKLRGAPGDGANPAASDRPTREIVVVIIGDGVMKLALQNQISAAGVERHIRMLPLLLERDYRDMLMASDVCLVTQAPGTGQYFFPSKLLSVLAAGTPVLSVADRDSELARAVDEGRFGVNVAPGNPQALADKLRELAENPAPLTEMRIRTSWVRRFSASHVLGAFEQRLRETVETKPG
jgi:colanic acid biosynthesis glycosyl transferase WcaI